MLKRAPRMSRSTLPVAESCASVGAPRNSFLSLEAQIRNCLLQPIFPSQKLKIAPLQTRLGRKTAKDSEMERTSEFLNITTEGLWRRGEERRQALLASAIQRSARVKTCGVCAPRFHVLRFHPSPGNYSIIFFDSCILSVFILLYLLLHWRSMLLSYYMLVTTAI